MASIIVRFVDAPAFITEAIDFFTNSLWPHAELGVTDASGTITGWLGAHAGTGVQLRQLDYCEPKRERRYALPVTDEQHSLIMGWAQTHIGEPYNYSDIAGLALHLRNLSGRGNEVICSQFVTEALQQGSVFPLNIEPSMDFLITPRDLHLSSLMIGNCIYSFPPEAL